MTDTHLETITVPKAGSEWKYDGIPITVVRIIVDWQYVDDGCFSVWGRHSNPDSFTDGQRFTPVAASFEAGHEYHDKISGDVFRVYEVDKHYAYGVMVCNETGSKQPEGHLHTVAKTFEHKGLIS